MTDFEAAVARLEAKGISLKDVNFKPDAPKVSAYLDIADPEGNFVHLL